MSDIRLRTEKRSYTFWQRVSIWISGVRHAVTEAPPRDYSIWIRVRKGEAGYDEASWSFDTVSNPARYVIQDGKYVQVNSKSVTGQPNPDWHNVAP